MVEKMLEIDCRALFDTDQFWGVTVTTKLKILWLRLAIATHLEDLTGAEIEERRKKVFGGYSGFASVFTSCRASGRICFWRRTSMIRTCQGKTHISSDLSEGFPARLQSLG